MKAIILKQFGGIENLSITELPVPIATEDEVLVKIKSISINPVDVKTRAGKGVSAVLKNDNPMILGWDLSGTIETVGAKVRNFKTGDEVFAMVRFPQSGKVYAEYAAVPAAQLALKPADVTHEEAAAACLAALTAWQSLTINYELKSGEKSAHPCSFRRSRTLCSANGQIPGSLCDRHFLGCQQRFCPVTGCR